MKGLVQLIAFVLLLVGVHHRHDDIWGTLLVLLIIDVVSTHQLHRDVARGMPFGNPYREYTEGLDDEMKSGIAHSLGTLPGAAYDGWSARKETAYNLGSRIWANLAFIPLMLVMEGCCIHKWWL
jgi:hypothetical protein